MSEADDSAQVRVEHRGRVWVVAGDDFCSGHADDANTTCVPFAPVRCECFIIESTFGLPIHRWRPQTEVMAQINSDQDSDQDSEVPAAAPPVEAASD